MNEYIEFFLRHWELSLAFIGILIALIFTEIKKADSGAGVSSQEAVQLINHQNANVVDLRNQDLFKHSHIIGAINMPISDLDAKLKRFSKNTKKPLILVCNNGQESAKLLTKFQQQGFKSVNYLSGGLQAWLQDGLPVTKAKA